MIFLDRCRITFPLETLNRHKSALFLLLLELLFLIRFVIVWVFVVVYMFSSVVVDVTQGDSRS